MAEYEIVTDYAFDVAQSMVESWGIKFCSPSVMIGDDDTPQSIPDVDLADFYRQMRNGAVTKTSAVALGDYMETFTGILEEGKDVLYLGMSTGITGTFHTAETAASMLKDNFPARRIVAVDTLSMSGGLGLLLYLVAQRRDAGADIDELAAYVREIMPHVCHWFTVDDLCYLARGGRIGSTSAAIAGALDIKPVCHTDDAGYLVAVKKVHGRTKAIRGLAKHYEETAIDKDTPAIICHADCIDDALALKKLVLKIDPEREVLIDCIGPIVGAHSGPGTLAFFFLGEHR